MAVTLIKEMARNTSQSFSHSAPHWVAYEVFRSPGTLSNIRKSSNLPGVVLVVSGTKKHPNNVVTFQITPSSRTHVNLVVEYDEVNTTLDVVSAVNYILGY